MKPKMKYVKGCIEIHTDNITSYTHALRKNDFFSQLGYGKGVYFFFKNHLGVEFFNKHRAFFEKHWDVDPLVIQELSSWDGYTDEHELITPKYLPGIILEDYQEIALKYLLTNKKFCIFLGQGTGKTLITITALNSIFEAEGPKKVLIVTPKKVIGQYQKEIDVYLKGSDITVTNYEQLKNLSGPYDIICYDESHRLKNCMSGLNKIATNLRADRIYLFTGSPQDKMKHEILAQLRVLNPYLFPAKYKVFERFFVLDEYGSPIREKRSEELNYVIENMSYGDKTENLLTLPDMKHHIINCHFKDRQYYDHLLKHKVVTIPPDHEILVDSPGAHRMKLRQLCCGHATYRKFDKVTCKETPAFLETENPKMIPLLDVVSTLDTGVIYTQFDYDIEVISKEFKKRGITHVCVNGKTKDSDPLIDDFQKGIVDFLVIQSVSGNAGLNLQHTNNVIFYALPESYIIFEQCMYRIRRRGQTKVCNYYYLISPGTVERSIYRSLQNKKSFSNKMFELYRKDE